MLIFVVLSFGKSHSTISVSFGKIVAVPLGIAVKSSTGRGWHTSDIGAGWHTSDIDAVWHTSDIGAGWHTSDIDAVWHTSDIGAGWIKLFYHIA